MDQTRYRWCRMNNPRYIAYHDNEWGKPQHDDRMLFELLVLESFQSGLSWETILNKREGFRHAFDGFDPGLVKDYDDVKVQSLLQNSEIIRNRNKVCAAVNNASKFIEIQMEWGSFRDYIWHFTEGKTVFEVGRSESSLSDMISDDLKRRGMKFVGSTTIYSYLQAIGILYSHEVNCVLYRSE